MLNWFFEFLKIYFKKMYLYLLSNYIRGWIFNVDRENDLFCRKRDYIFIKIIF